MHLLRKKVNVSLPQIGEVFGDRDHTTVMYAIEKISRGIKDDSGSKICRDIMRLKEQLYQQAQSVI